MKKFFQSVLPLVFFVGALYVGSKLIGSPNIKEQIASLGLLGLVVFTALKASTIIIAPLGGNPLYLMAGPLFGFTKGVICLFIGDVIGYAGAFLVARRYGRRILKVLFTDEQIKYADEILEKLNTWKGLMFARIFFFGYSDLVSYASGLAKIPFWQYMVVTLPMIVVNIVFFMALGSIFVTSPLKYTLAVMVLALIPTVIFLLRHHYLKREGIQNN